MILVLILYRVTGSKQLERNTIIKQFKKVNLFPPLTYSIVLHCLRMFNLDNLTVLTLPRRTFLLMIVIAHLGAE